MFEAYLRGIETQDAGLDEVWRIQFEAYRRGIETLLVGWQWSCIVAFEAYLRGIETKFKATARTKALCLKPT
mgnify:FL=1